MYFTKVKNVAIGYDLCIHGIFSYCSYYIDINTHTTVEISTKAFFLGY